MPYSLKDALWNLSATAAGGKTQLFQNEKEDLNIWLPTLLSVQIFFFSFILLFFVKEYFNSEKGNLWLVWFLPNFHKDASKQTSFY